jgi:hypothetical protein
MANREEILKQIRIMGKGTRGALPAILDLPGDTLWEVFQQMQRGLSNRAVARHLIKCGMSGTENSLQQTLSLFRKRISPLLAEESATPCLPEVALKLPVGASSLAPDETLSTVRAIVKDYGEAIRQLTEAAARKGAPLGEDVSKHAKAYSALVATKARLEQTVIKSEPVEPPQDRSFQEQADRVHEWLSEDKDTMDRMKIASERMLKRLDEMRITMERDPTTGEWHKVTGPPGRDLLNKR